MKDAVKDLAERSVEVIDLSLPSLGLRATLLPQCVPDQTPADLIALGAPDSHVTTRALFQDFYDLDLGCEVTELNALDHGNCLYATSNRERQEYLDTFGVQWDPELRF